MHGTNGALPYAGFATPAEFRMCNKGNRPRAGLLKDLHGTKGNAQTAVRALLNVDGDLVSHILHTVLSFIRLARW
jgi:hypothetical protein